MNSLNKLIYILSARDRRQALLVLLLIFGMALLEMVGVASIMPFLAVLGNPNIIETNEILNYLFTSLRSYGVDSLNIFLIILGAASFSLIIISAVYRSYTHFSINRFIEMQRYSIGAALLEFYMRRPFTFFLEKHSGELAKNIFSEVDHLVQNVIRPIFNMVAFGLVAIVILALLIAVNTKLTLSMILIFGGTYSAIFIAFSKRFTSMGKTLVNANKKRFTAASESLNGIKDIKLYGCEEIYLGRFASPSNEFASVSATYQTLSLLPKYLLESIAFGGVIALIVVLLSFQANTNEFYLGDLLPILGLYSLATYRLLPALQNMYNGGVSLRYGKAAIDNLYSEFNQNHTCKDCVPVNAGKPYRILKDIRVKNLSYCYPNSSRQVLSGISLEIQKGSTVGFVGSTGSGKSTLIDVILGLLQPTQGNVFIDDVPLNEEFIRDWQRTIGYVPQQIYLADSSIAENIALGVSLEDIDKQRLEDCARTAQLNDFISEELTDGYKTQIGERGIRLSGGQRQRIGIARALYRGPDVLILDEATSALDVITEKAVMKGIQDLMGEITILMVAHRLKTLRNCDNIFFMKNGEILATGTFDELQTSSKDFSLMSNH